MAKIGIIGGTGLTRMTGLEVTRRQVMRTPYGEPSGAFAWGQLDDNEVVFLARHGHQHTIPPHKINYRANIWAMKQLELDCVIAFAAVGGINPDMPPPRVVIPNQMVDYTYGREHTFFDEDLDEVTHIDFTEPYTAAIRQALINAASESGVDAADYGVYACTQGPRLETAAEIDRLEKDGCDIVGMTGMPEAALARELGLDYAAIAVVANEAAGRGEAEITLADIERNLQQGMLDAVKVLQAFLPYKK